MTTATEPRRSINVRMSNELLAAINYAAKVERRKRSDLIYHALLDQLIARGLLSTKDVRSG